MSTHRLAPEEKSRVSPISTMSPWKFDDLSASGSKREAGSPRHSGSGFNNYGESPLVGKYTLSAHRDIEEVRPNSLLKLEKV